MIPELGHFALILAALVSLILGTLPLIGAHQNRMAWVAVARPAASALALLVTFSFACLTQAFVSNDFSVVYVAQHSNSLLPLQYRVAAVWGGHEGSLLLWMLMLTWWAFGVAMLSRQLPEAMVARVLGTLGLVAFGFLLFILITSSPFERLLPGAAEGRDLNPLLQDFGLVIHPPLLYMGYVGFSVAFAFAIAALLSGQLDAAWARWSRPWTMAAWCFLTLGIAMGSWWAYYELGWGGWWFWDPVENASFMPWLAGTALLHSLAVSEKRGVFKAWTVLLAIIAFSLSLLGTFLVRSGVLTSVHAFAADPTRGLYILGILVVVVGGSLSLFAWRGASLQRDSNHGPFSREMFLLLNNLFLLTATVVVLLGTLFPLIADALALGKFSVGPPYFNLLFVPLTLLLLFFMGIGPATNWKKQSVDVILLPLRKVLLAAVIIAIALPLAFFGNWPWQVGLTVGLCAWVFGSQLVDIARKSQNASTRIKGLSRLTRSYWGMQLAHLGLLVTVLGVAFTSAYSIEKDVRLAPGESITVNGYAFRFDGVQDHQGPNYVAQRGTLEVSHDGFVEVLHPEKRIYRVQQSPMTEAAITGNTFRDLYVALGEPLDAGAWAVRIYHKPMIRWIWFGALMMAFGGLLSMLDKRYRLKSAGGR